MDSCSKQVVCVNCSTENVYNPKYKKDKCDKCGELLSEYIMSASTEEVVQEGIDSAESAANPSQSQNVLRQISPLKVNIKGRSKEHPEEIAEKEAKKIGLKEISSEIIGLGYFRPFLLCARQGAFTWR